MKRWIALVCSCVVFIGTAVAQETIFTFNGRLTDSAALANNVYDVEFELFSAQSGGVSVSAVVSTNNLPVTNGLFVAFLDFGAVPFSGATRFLEIRVRPGGTADPYTTLAPRLQITSVPYAIRAAVATTVSGSAGLRIETNATSPNLIGGYSSNQVAFPAIGGTIGGGGEPGAPNQVLMNFGTIGGGRGNLLAGRDATIGGGRNNHVASNATQGVIGGGSANHLEGFANVVGGGINNTNFNSGGTIGGGERNLIHRMFYGTIGGGAVNRIHLNSDQATIAGGGVNTVLGSSAYATIGGGGGNTIQTNSDCAIIAGGSSNIIETNGQYNVVSGGRSNVVGGWNTFVGTPNPAATYSSIGGGRENRVQRSYSLVGGGEKNTNFNAHSVIGGGQNNYITGVAYQDSGTNCCEGVGNTIGGGINNLIRNYLVFPFGSVSTIGGGYSNMVTGFAGTVPGGEGNSAGSYAFAAGWRASARTSSFVWADSGGTTFSDTRGDQFAIRAGGGVRIQSERGIALNAADRPLITREFDPFTSGNYDGQGRWGLFMEPSALTVGIPAVAGKVLRVSKYNANSTINAHLMTVDQSGTVTAFAFNPTSDRNAKTNFAAIDSSEILRRVLRLPIQTWTFRNDDGQTRHIGPTAQDFHAAFGVGTDDRHISTVDADGVALAAIQGLHQALQETRQELATRDAEMKRLREEYRSLKQIVRALVQRAEERPLAEPTALRTGL